MTSVQTVIVGIGNDPEGDIPALFSASHLWSLVHVGSDASVGCQPSGFPRHGDVLQISGVDVALTIYEARRALADNSMAPTMPIAKRAPSPIAVIACVTRSKLASPNNAPRASS